AALATDDDRVRRRLDERAEARFGAAQGLLGAPALGDVGEEADRGGDAVDVDARGADMYVQMRSVGVDHGHLERRLERLVPRTARDALFDDGARLGRDQRDQVGRVDLLATAPEDLERAPGQVDGAELGDEGGDRHAHARALRGFEHRFADTRNVTRTAGAHRRTVFQVRAPAVNDDARWGAPRGSARVRGPMAYTVLARKYRPQTFADLVGQEHVTRTLSNAI